ncbi:MAG: hypothetical protein EZS28_011514, partial [Streblomastix strix]
MVEYGKGYAQIEEEGEGKSQEVIVDGFGEEKRKRWLHKSSQNNESDKKKKKKKKEETDLGQFEISDNKLSLINSSDPRKKKEKKRKSGGHDLQQDRKNKIQQVNIPDDQSEDEKSVSGYDQEGSDFDGKEMEKRQSEHYNIHDPTCILWRKSFFSFLFSAQHRHSLYNPYEPSHVTLDGDILEHMKSRLSQHGRREVTRGGISYALVLFSPAPPALDNKDPLLKHKQQRALLGYWDHYAYLDMCNTELWRNSETSSKKFNFIFKQKSFIENSRFKQIEEDVRSRIEISMTQLLLTSNISSFGIYTLPAGPPYIPRVPFELEPKYSKNQNWPQNELYNQIYKTQRRRDMWSSEFESGELNENEINSKKKKFNQNTLREQKRENNIFDIFKLFNSYLYPNEYSVTPDNPSYCPAFAYQKSPAFNIPYQYSSLFFPLQQL